MNQFEYHAPATLEAAAAQFHKGDEAAFLAGGMTLLPTIAQHLAEPSDLVDLARVDGLRGIRVDQTAVSIGAMTRHADVAASAEVRSAIPALADLAGLIGDAQVRNRGTMGGSVANSDPAADYPAAVVGLGATIHTDRREIAADDYFLDLFETALGSGEILTRITFPRPLAAAYCKFPNPASRYAVVGVFVARFPDGVRVGVTGAAPCAHRWNALEEALTADFSGAALAGLAVPADGLNEDMHASAEYRAHLVAVMARRAVDKLTA